MDRFRDRAHRRRGRSASSCPTSRWATCTNVYEPWSTWAIEGRAIVGITEPWVYPQLALVPMVLAQGFAWIAGYEVAWAILVDALRRARVRDARRQAAARAGRIDRGVVLARVHRCCSGRSACTASTAITVPLALAGCLWLVGRPWLGSILLAVATWIKVWPAALLAAAVIAVRRRARGRRRRADRLGA